MQIGTIIRNNYTNTNNPTHISIYIGNNMAIYPYKDELSILGLDEYFQDIKTLDGELGFEPVGFCSFEDMIKESYDKHMEMDKVKEIGQSAKTKQLVEKLEKTQEKHEKADEYSQSIGLDEVIEVVTTKLEESWIDILQKRIELHDSSMGYENYSYVEACIKGIEEGIAIIERWKKL